MVRTAVTDRHTVNPDVTAQLVTQLDALADSVTDGHPNPHLLLSHLLGISTDQLPKAAPEAPSSPCSTPPPTAPASPTPDPLDVPF